MSWQEDLKKLNVSIELLDNPRLMLLKLNINPSVIRYNGFILPMKIKQKHIDKTTIKNIVLEFKRISENIINIVNIYLIDTWHPNSTYIEYNPLNDISFSQKNIYKYCFDKFSFDETSPITFINQISYLLFDLNIWNYDNAYWRDFNMINLDINDSDIYINHEIGKKINGRQLKRKFKQHKRILNLSLFINKLYDIPVKTIEENLLNFRFLFG